MDTPIHHAATRYERLVGYIAPALARRIHATRVAFEYEAARSSRMRQSATTLSTPETFRGARDRIQLMKEARDLWDNFGFHAAILATTEMYVVGNLWYQPETGDTGADEEYFEYLRTMLFEQCDISGRMSFEEMVGLAYMQACNDGDFGLARRRVGDRLYLQGIEADRIGDPNESRVEPGYVGGVTYDVATGRPLSYRVYRRTPAEGYVDPQEVSPLDFSHVTMRKRHDEYRGRSRFAACLKEERDAKEILEAERVGVKFDCYHAAVAYTETGQPNDDPGEFIDSTTERKGNGSFQKEEDLPMGKIRYMQRTDNFQFLNSSRPSATFNGFIETLVNLIAVSWPLPKEFVWSLLGTGPAVRAAAAKAHRTFQRDQFRLRRQALEPNKNAWLLNAFAQGHLTMVQPKKSSRFASAWDRGTWHFPPAITIDVGRDSKAGIDEWRAGFLTAADWAGEDGKDWRKRYRQMFVEAKEAEKLGAEFQLDPDKVIQRQPKAAAPAASEDPPASKVGPG